MPYNKFMMIGSLILLVGMSQYNSLHLPSESRLKSFQKNTQTWLLNFGEKIPTGWVVNKSNQRLSLSSKHKGLATLQINPDAKSNCLLVSPHPFFDTHSKEIAKALFEKICKGFLYSNTHRKTEYINGTTPRFYEPTRHNRSYLQAFTRAWANSYPNSIHIQLHGFDSNKRKTLPGRKAQIIISDGSHNPSALLFSLQQCFRRQGFVNTFVFGKDISELGATKNAQRSVLVEKDNFIHIELSNETRRTLMTYPQKLKKVARCFDL